MSDAPKKKSKGLVEFTFSQDHGNSKKGDTQRMHSTTAEALVAHKIGIIGKAIDKIIKDPK